MIDALVFISQRPIVIAFAILGAALVMAGSLTARSGTARSSLPDNAAKGKAPRSALSRHLTTTGYVITFVSITLFIIAGFVSDL